MYSKEEKILILGALFHDIGKFNQRCTGNPKRETHQSIGEKFINDFDYLFTPIVGNDLTQLKKIINEHHNKDVDQLTTIVQISDWISAGERIKKYETEKDLDNKWSHKYLSSLFSKINLNSSDKIDPRYYRQEYLINENYNVLIPKFETEDEALKSRNQYTSTNWKEFTEDIKIVFESFNEDNDFDSLINMMLLVFEKYMWCIPDFTGSSETDISLYNHLKDVCALSHSIYLSQKENKNNRHLCLLIGDIPGIQKYIFNVLNTKAAKMLRGRSDFIQILSRNFATEILEAFGLTECNLIMLAGGKFYILATFQSEEKFNEILDKVKSKIDKYLYSEFKLDLQFATGKYVFDFEELRESKITFGEIIESANSDLLKGRNQMFENIFFENELNEKSFIIGDGFAENTENDSNSIKCKLTDEPVLRNRETKVKIPSDDGLQELFVDKQAKAEYEVGDKVVDNNTIIQYSDESNLKIEENGIFEFGKKDVNPTKRKIVLNPVLETLLKSGKGKISFLKNSRFIEVANYTSQDNKNVLDFEKMSDIGDGAKFLTVIKGDIDNLGLIMAYGLDNDLTAISRTTTLSNHLKYFFSFFINGFLKDKDKKEGIKSYIIFAGGDDLIFVCHQNNAIKLLDEFNSVFNDFVCANKEVHISYSITHFKSGTPIRLVAGFADENQEKVKKYSSTYESVKKMLEKEDCFFENNNKSSTLIFETGLKNSELAELKSKTELLTSWVEENKTDPKKGISMGVLRNLMQLLEMMKAYRENGDTSKLIWHPMLTYMINRLLKDKNGEYRDNEVGKFFVDVLKLNKNERDIKLEKILYPAICGAIYKLRK